MQYRLKHTSNHCYYLLLYVTTNYGRNELLQNSKLELSTHKNYKFNFLNMILTPPVNSSR